MGETANLLQICDEHVLFCGQTALHVNCLKPPRQQIVCTGSSNHHSFDRICLTQHNPPGCTHLSPIFYRRGTNLALVSLETKRPLSSDYVEIRFLLQEFSQGLNDFGCNYEILRKSLGPKNPTSLRLRLHFTILRFKQTSSSCYAREPAELK